MRMMRGNVNKKIAKEGFKSYQYPLATSQKNMCLYRSRKFFTLPSIGYKLAFYLALSSVGISSAFALSPMEATQLEKLDPQTRIEQRCDIEAMSRLGKESRWRPDKVLAYAFSDPVMSKHTVKAKGAAFRSGGNWYRLSYTCKTQDDFLTIKSFEYKTGDLIPRKDWDRHYLVP